MASVSLIVAIAAYLLAWVIVLYRDPQEIGFRITIGAGFFVLVLSYLMLSGVKQDDFIIPCGFMSVPLISALIHRWAQHYSMKKHKREFQLQMSPGAMKFFRIKKHKYAYSWSDSVFTTLLVSSTMFWGLIVIYLIRLSGL